MKHILTISLVAMLSFTQAMAQYFVGYRNDTTYFDTDSVQFSIEGVDSISDWEISKDGKSWESLHTATTVLNVRIDSAAAYRALSRVDGCPVISDTVQTGINVIHVEDVFTIKPGAAVYELNSGLQVKVPSNTFSQDQQISFTSLDSTQAKAVIPFPADDGKLFVGAYQVSSSVIRVQKAVRLRIPAPDLFPGQLPRIYQYNESSDEWSFITSPVYVNYSSGYAEFSTLHLQSFLILSQPGLIKPGNKSVSAAKGDTNLVTDPCYNEIQINSTMIDRTTLAGNSECYYIQETGEVRFLKCKFKPPENWQIREIGKQCVPRIRVTIDQLENKEFIKVGEVVTLTFFTYFHYEDRDIPIPDQYIDFTLPAGLTGAAYPDKTDAKGLRQVNLTAVSENLDGFINYSVNYDYCLEYIRASNGILTEESCTGSHVSLHEGIKRVVIYNECQPPGDIDCSLSDDPSCGAVKDNLEKDLMLIPEKVVLNFNDSKPMGIVVNGIPFMSSPELELSYFSSDPSIVQVDEISGMLTAGDVEGSTTIIAYVCDYSDTADVSVQNLNCDSAKVKIGQTQLNMKVNGRCKIDVTFERSADGIIYKPPLYFNSDNTLCAEVDENGFVTAKAAGSSVIHVQWCSEDYLIPVTVAPVDYCDSVDLAVPTGTIYLHTNENYVISPVFKKTTAGNLYVTEVFFESENQSIVAVDANGVLTGIGEGETHIVVSWCNEVRRIPVIINDQESFYKVVVDVTRSYNGIGISRGGFFSYDGLRCYVNSVYIRNNLSVLNGSKVFASGPSIPGGPLMDDLAAIYHHFYKSEYFGYSNHPDCIEHALSIDNSNKISCDVTCTYHIVDSATAYLDINVPALSGFGYSTWDASYFSGEVKSNNYNWSFGCGDPNYWYYEKFDFLSGKVLHSSDGKFYSHTIDLSYFPESGDTRYSNTYGLVNIYGTISIEKIPGAQER